MAAVEVVASTGDGEDVRVFDLGPRNETMTPIKTPVLCHTRSPGDQHGISISFVSGNRRTQEDAGGQFGEQDEYEKRKFGNDRAEIQHLQSWLGLKA